MVVGIIDNQLAVAQALQRSLATLEGIETILIDANADGLMNAIHEQGVNVVLFNLHLNPPDEYFMIMHGLVQRFERLRVMCMLQKDDKNMVVRCIKAGSKGVLGTTSDFDELYRALLTVRGGYEYFSQPIANLLIDNYVSDMVGKEEASGELDALSPRQIEILRLWGENFTNQQIADQLYLSVRTVETHKNHIMQRLNLKSTVDIIKFGIRNNIIQL